MNVAALFVDRLGVYADALRVDVWDVTRDARLYAGPHPVVAHPPCERWCQLAPLNASQHGYALGDDEGCFASALDCVRAFGGVLEHPAYSYAWPAFGLPRPGRWGWTRALDDDGWTTEISGSAYGHPTRKRTWLYYVGDEPPAAMRWHEPVVAASVSCASWRRGVRPKFSEGTRFTPRQNAATPVGLRDALLGLARASVGLVRCA